jgi:3-deoxy-7-phosphoheptulonate synthase
MRPTQDIRIIKYDRLVSPDALKGELPMTEAANRTVVEGREAIQRILAGVDRRLIVIVGPCSVHDERETIEYAERLKALADRVADKLLVVMRVYLEKPRTTIGWKGLISDPHLDGSCDIHAGLRISRRILLRIAEMGLPTATEMVETITPQYLADLICWAAIGARTTESPTHREMASGLSMPVGFKNGTDGNLETALNAMTASRAPQSFLGVDTEGNAAVVRTAGNPWGHLVLRGGSRPNFDFLSIEEARLMLLGRSLPEAILVDCSHANSLKKHQGQALVWKSIIRQRKAGNEAIIGMMLESYLAEGNQKLAGLASLQPGVSITDACISWETTEDLLLFACDELSERRIAAAV